MSLIPTVYSSTDPGAPQLSGTVGSLIALLRAVLVNGYGSGADVKPGAGWTEDFTGSGVAVFRNAPVTGTGYRLRVLDDGSAAAGGSARSATVRAYEDMSDVDTGVNPAPTVAQLANGCLWIKSSVSDASGRPWFAFANERWIYLLVDANGTATYAVIPNFAGDLDSIKAGDNHCFMVSGTDETSYTGSTSDYSRSRLFGFQSRSTAAGQWGGFFNAGTACGYLGRAHDQSIGAVLCTCDAPTNSDTTHAVYGSSENSGEMYPSVISGGLMFEQGVVREAIGVRGFLPGMFVPLHVGGMADGAVLADIEGMPPGTSFLFKEFGSNARSPSGFVLFNLGSLQ